MSRTRLMRRPPDRKRTLFVCVSAPLVARFVSPLALRREVVSYARVSPAATSASSTVG